MGRETVAVAHWRGEVAEVKALLESQEIILRGTIRARMARSGIANVAVDGEVLTLLSDGEPLVLGLGAKEAAKWRDTLAKPPPSLASKLGIGEGRPAFVMGTGDDIALADALEGARCATTAEAGVLLAILATEADLMSAYAVAEQNPQLMLWCVYPKGKGAAYGDTAIRNFLRQRGYVDSKSCAVSPELTATRYGRKE